MMRRGPHPCCAGLYHAIIDGADSALIDEARAPLILSAGKDSWDEADSALIDEARAPLILSAGKDSRNRQVAVFERALDICDRPRPGADYALLKSERGAMLLPPGSRAIDALCPNDAAQGDWARATPDMAGIALLSAGDMVLT
jgi:preprotein translocase subunit SecA